MTIWRRLIRRHRQSPNGNCADNNSDAILEFPLRVADGAAKWHPPEQIEHFSIGSEAILKGEAPMAKTRDDLNKAQREEQARHERALDKKQKPRRSDERAEDSQRRQERKDDARD
jgi:hypothetical protein